jgi:Domain of unknown function (DUF4349)
LRQGLAKQSSESLYGYRDAGPPSAHPGVAPQDHDEVTVPGAPAHTGAAGAPAAESASGKADEPAAGSAKALTLSALADSRPDRYLIKNATLTLEANDARQASSRLVAAVQAARGYVSDNHETVDALGTRSITIEVRVPFVRFDRALLEIEALGKVLEKQISAQDVTEEFVDSQAKLRNLQRTELRLLEHLNRTGRLADTLLVEKELSRVRGAIDQLEGRLRYLAHRVAFSTLTITLTEAARPQQMAPPESFSTTKEVADAVRSLVVFGRGLWTAAIWVGVWSTVWGPFALVVWLVYRRLRPPVAG